VLLVPFVPFFLVILSCKAKFSFVSRTRFVGCASSSSPSSRRFRVAVALGARPGCSTAYATC
jgi:hypothetical protein